MDRGIEPNLQRIIGSARHQDTSEDSPSYAFMDNSQGSGFNFAPAIRRQPVQDLLSCNDLDRNQFGRAFSASRNLVQDVVPHNDFSRKQSGYESFRPLVPSSSSHRMSLAPRNVLNQPEFRAITNEDNHSKIKANLHLGIPFNAARQMESSIHSYSPMTQLANDMLLPLLAQQTSPELSVFQGGNQNRYSQLQPQRQQITPPFNLSGVVYSPNALGNPNGSSPMQQISSPSVRASQRRTVSRSQPHASQPREQDVEELRQAPETPRKQIIANPADVEGTREMVSLGHSPPIAQGIQLIPPESLSGDRTRSIFPYELFNAVQSKCFAPIYKTDDNIIVSAPTGSGKTALLELAICRLMDIHRGSAQYKIVYMAPIKSLCSERVRDWHKKFGPLGLSCAELTGDTGTAEMSKVRNASVIITTPEKWDSITRKWKDHGKLLEMVKLFLIDEVHILNDPRGATLEAVVSRMKTIGTNIRFIALSATVPNSQDIALWLGKGHTSNHLPAHRETFGEDFRPVKLQKHVYGIDGPLNDFAFDKTLDGKLPKLIAKYTHKKPMMVFCFTKKSCEKTAAVLAEIWTKQRAVDRAWLAPAKEVPVGSKDLQDLVSCGVAFHHAGLDAQDRHAVESGFLHGNISVICCTSTLAVGVNLPCHLVVLKGTVRFRATSCEEYSDLEVMQMLGRAGRPQFDDSAVAIIMTRNNQVNRYEKMISGQDILESTLHLNLIEHLNSEIGLGTVCDLYSAKQWLAGTFLSVRMRQNPDYYKIAGTGPWRDVDEQLEWVCNRDTKLLQAHKLVTDEKRFKCTEYGQAMSRYMVQFETMKLLLSIPQHATVEQTLDVLCQASEFKDLRMKATERPHLRELNKSPFLKFPVEENISTTAHKVSLLIQIQLGGVDLPTDKDFTVGFKRQFQVDKSIIFERIQRLIRCVVDCKVIDCDAIAARHGLDLARALSAGFWETSSLQLRQIPQVGPVAMRKLASSNINTIEKLAILDSAGIERVIGRNPPFGRKMQEILARFPKLTLRGEVTGRVPSRAGQPVKANVKVKLGIINKDVPVWNGKAPSVTLTAETCDGTLVHFWRGPIGKLNKGWEEKFTAELSGPHDEVVCQLSCDDIVGTIRSDVLKHNIPASAFPPPKLMPKIQSQSTKTKESLRFKDEFGGEDFEDGELLAAVKDVEGSGATESFEDIDDFVESSPDPSRLPKSKTPEVSQPVRMGNGKYQCNHHCRGGLTLKNGRPCKHKCCHEGLDKPRKARERKKSSTGMENEQAARTKQAQTISVKSNASNINTKRSKDDTQPQQLKPKTLKYGDKNEEDVEVIDLAKEPSPTPYSSVDPRDYRKLHKLHGSVQEDKPIRLGNKKPKFAYASGADLLSFLDSQIQNHFDGTTMRTPPNPLSDDSFEFPSPSKISQRSKATSPTEDCNDDATLDLSGINNENPALTSSYEENSLENLEMGMVGLGDLMAFQSQKTQTPKLSSSFENSVLDLSSYNDGTETQPEEKVSTPSTSPRENLKRAGDDYSSNLHNVKRPCTAQDEERRQTNVEPSLPAWLGDFDSDLIGELKGIVDFVD